MRGGRAAALGLGVALGLLLLAPADAHPLVPGATVQWAYGGTLEASGIAPVGSVATHFGDQTNYAVVLSQSSLGGGETRVHVVRVLATKGDLTACYPNCTDPSYRLDGYSRGWESENATLVLSPTATVTLNGSTSYALGLVSENLSLEGNLTVSLTWSNLTAPNAPEIEWFNASTAANSTGTLSFGSAPLGLIPASFGAGSEWSAQSEVTETATTAFAGAYAYQGNLIPANHSGFSDTTTPISPAIVTVSGADSGASATPGLGGDAAVGLLPQGGTDSLLEGDLLVPSSAYLFSGFSASCGLAQRPCAANASTPELDVNRTESDHLGWDAAVSSIAPFALRFDDQDVYDLPNGAPFWPASAGLGPVPRSGGPATLAPTIAGVPEPVGAAEAVQAAWLFTGPNRTGGSGGSAGAVPIVPPHVPHGAGTPARAALGPAGRAPPSEILPELAFGLALAATAILVAVAAVRRKKGRRPEPEEPAAIEERPGTDGPEDDPLGYVW